MSLSLLCPAIEDPRTDKLIRFLNPVRRNRNHGTTPLYRPFSTIRIFQGEASPRTAEERLAFDELVKKIREFSGRIISMFHLFVRDCLDRLRCGVAYHINFWKRLTPTHVVSSLLGSFDFNRFTHILYSVKKSYRKISGVEKRFIRFPKIGGASVKKRVGKKRRRHIPERKQINMGTHLHIIGPGKKYRRTYIYPTSGGIKLYVESTVPVDVIVTSEDNARAVRSREEAQVLSGHGQAFFRTDVTDLTETMSIPPKWQDGWQIVIGNIGEKEAVVYCRIKTEVVLDPNLFGETE